MVLKSFKFEHLVIYNLALLDMSSEVRVEGLETLDYLDNLQNRERFTEQGDAITFESEVSVCHLSSLVMLFPGSGLNTCAMFLCLIRLTRSILALLQRLQFWIMKRREHL